MSKKNSHNTNVGSSVERSDSRIDTTGEVFTPVELCRQMVADIPKHIMEDKNSTFLDNSAGSGNFLLALKEALLEYGHTEDHIKNNMLYAIELMPDNHAELCKNIGVPVNHRHYINGSGLDESIYNKWENEKGNTLEGSPFECL